MLAGIDFGSKLSGNTVIAYLDEKDVLSFSQSPANKDADDFILGFTEYKRISILCIDAPLSLPGRYRDLPGCNDYFYRKCDRIGKAMSPMFLGGLTARAMKLRHALQLTGIRVFEAYPKLVAEKLGLLEMGYKKDHSALITCRRVIEKASLLKKIPSDSLTTWHHFDALLALLIAIKIRDGYAESIGDPVEGQIFF